MLKYGESEQVKEVKRLIEALTPKERAMLAPWLLARYNVQGYPNPRTGS